MALITSMKFHFVYLDLLTNYPTTQMGIAYLSAALKNAGHDVFLSHITDRKQDAPSKILEDVRKFGWIKIIKTKRDLRLFVKKKPRMPVKSSGVHY